MCFDFIHRLNNVLAIFDFLTFQYFSKLKNVKITRSENSNEINPNHAQLIKKTQTKHRKTSLSRYNLFIFYFLLRTAVSPAPVADDRDVADLPVDGVSENKKK